MSNFGCSLIRCPMCSFPPSLPSANMGWGFACADSVAGDTDAKTSPRSEGVQGLWQRFSEGCEDNPVVCWGSWDWGWWRSPKWRGRWKPSSGQRHSCQSSHMPKTHSKGPSYLLLNSRCPTRLSLIGETPAYNYPTLISYLNRQNLLFKKIFGTLNIHHEHEETVVPVCVQSPPTNFSAVWDKCCRWMAFESPT